jgi:hypothetical protein
MDGIAVGIYPAWAATDGHSMLPSAVRTLA